jgi:CubicO group peptidase (beta-lactamase class C family)
MDLFCAPEFTANVKNPMDRYHVPGLAIAILQDEKIDSAGFGKASLDPPKDCTADTLFDIASTSKSLTAAAVALLVDDNDKYPLVQYETPMSNLLPDDFVTPGKNHVDVTLEDILSHRTGMAA